MSTATPMRAAGPAGVEVEAALIDLAAPCGHDARPADAEAIGARSELGHQPYVVAVTVVVVARDIAVVCVGRRPRSVRERVPDGRAAAVFLSRALDLVRRRGEAPDKAAREALRQRRWIVFLCVAHAPKDTFATQRGPGSAARPTPARNRKWDFQLPALGRSKRPCDYALRPPGPMLQRG